MKYLIIIALIIFGIGLFFRIRRRLLERRQYKEFLEIFDRQPIKLPTLIFGTVYYWPTFTVIFQNKTDYEFAQQNGLFETFNKGIQKFYGKDFRADLAITYKHT